MQRPGISETPCDQQPLTEHDDFIVSNLLCVLPAPPPPCWDETLKNVQKCNAGFLLTQGFMEKLDFQMLFEYSGRGWGGVRVATKNFVCARREIFTAILLHQQKPFPRR
jgi:hypothetical protein